MDLMGISGGAIQPINRNISVTWIQSTGGYTTDAAGRRTPTTSTTTLQAQVQATSAGDLRLIEGLNIQGQKRKVFLYGNVLGISRADQRGGDVLQFPEVPGGPVRNWKVVEVIETWPTWASVIVVLQTP